MIETIEPTTADYEAVDERAELGMTFGTYRRAMARAYAAGRESVAKFAGCEEEIATLKQQLAEAQAKLPKPGSVIFEPDGEPRGNSEHDWVLINGTVRGWDRSLGSTHRQVYRRVQ